jgi:hypothetical protein
MAAQRTVGKTLKLGINQTWVSIFESNFKRKWTDAKISEFMFCEFHPKKSAIFGAPNSVRGRYNRGVLTGNKAPKPQSTSFDADGKPIEGRVILHPRKALKTKKILSAKPKLKAKVKTKAVVVAKPKPKIKAKAKPKTKPKISTKAEMQQAVKDTSSSYATPKTGAPTGRLVLKIVRKQKSA